MAHDLLAVLVRLSIIATLTVLIISLLRAPARRVIGPEAAYWLWLLLPCSLVAVLLPRIPAAPSSQLAFAHPPMAQAVEMPAGLVPRIDGSDHALALTLLWGLGCLAVLAYFTSSQRALRRSLGALELQADGTYRSRASKQAMLIGVWRSKIVIPNDFETRYSAGERTLILAHEHAHLERGDALTNWVALVHVCLFWFNPLIYLAWSRFRFDQEIACDATVLRQLKPSRRYYARALAKSALSMTATLSFGWSRRHSLIERIALLKRPTPSRARRLAGHSLALVLTLSCAYATWAAQPSSPPVRIDAGPQITISLRWSVDGVEGNTVGYGSPRPPFVVSSGGEFRIPQGFGSLGWYLLKCVASLQRPEQVHPKQILLSCEVSDPDKVLTRPKLLVLDGRSATIQMTDPERKRSMRIELTASSDAPATVVPNFMNADIRQVVSALSSATRKNFIIDPRVHAYVTMLGATPMSREAFYARVLDLLHAHGIAAVPAGDFIKIVPDRNASSSLWQHGWSEHPQFDAISSSPLWGRPPGNP